MMTQDINIDVDKLFAPIEELGLKQRAYHMLKRTGIKQISDIVIMGKEKIMSIKNIGPLLGEHVISETAAFLDVTKDKLFTVDIVKLLILKKEKATRPMYDPIELLNLSPEIISILKKVGITRVADLIVSSDFQYVNLAKIDNVNFGKKTLRELDRELLIYLTSKSENDGTSKKVIFKVESNEANSSSDTELNFADIKKPNQIVEKPLAAIRQKEINKVDHNEGNNSSTIKLISADIKKPKSNSRKPPVVIRRKEINKIDRDESDNSSVIELISADIKQLNQIGVKPQVAIKQMEILSLALDALGINNRAWLIVELNANRFLSLKEIATDVGGITRGRVHHIINQVLEKIRANIKPLSTFFDFFEKIAIENRSKLENETFSINTLVEHLNKGFIDSHLYATDEDIEKLITLIRVLVLHRKPWVEELIEANWANIVFLSSLVDPAIEIGGGIRQGAGTQRKREASYKTLAISVLNESRKPMHWSEIAKQAEKLSNRHNFETRGLYSVLLTNDDVFVRVGQGTYELVEWGSKSIEPYPDIIASILKKENRSLHAEIIFSKVSAVRPIKLTSLHLYLDLHPRFYKSINNTYGLRGWLPSRDKQNLRTPEWLVEDSKSFERVERATQKGYDVERIIEEDKLQ